MVADRDQCVLRIVDAADVDAARAVLAELAPTAWDLAGERPVVSYVSEVMDTPSGPMVLMDAKGLRPKELERLLESLLDAAERVGLDSGVLQVPPPDRQLDWLSSVRLASFGLVVPPSDLTTTGRSFIEVPPRWVEVGVDWVREPGWGPVVVGVAGVGAEIDLASLGTWLSAVRPGKVRVTAGAVETGMRALVVSSGLTATHVSFASMGRAWGPAEHEVEALHIRDAVRACASEAAYGFVGPVPRLRDFGVAKYDIDTPFHPGFRSPRLFQDLPDVVAVDAFWYQVLGPGHLARTGPLPDTEDLGDGKVGLSIGEFGAWLDDLEIERSSPMEPGPLRSAGRAMLAGCFLSREEAQTLRNDRRGRL